MYCRTIYIHIEIRVKVTIYKNLRRLFLVVCVEWNFFELIANGVRCIVLAHRTNTVIYDVDAQFSV